MIVTTPIEPLPQPVTHLFQPIPEKLVLSAAHLLQSLLTTVRCEHFWSLQMLNTFYSQVADQLITGHSMEVSDDIVLRFTLNMTSI